MLKPLTLSLSLAVVLSLSGVSKAGGPFHYDSGCTTCGLASPQCPVAAPVASPQGYDCGAPVCTSGCGRGLNFGFLKKCGDGLKGMGHNLNCMGHDLWKACKPRPRCYTYEWVLKKKRVRCT